MNLMMSMMMIVMSHNFMKHKLELVKILLIEIQPDVIWILRFYEIFLERHFFENSLIRDCTITNKGLNLGICVEDYAACGNIILVLLFVLIITWRSTSLILKSENELRLACDVRRSRFKNTARSS